MRFFRRVALLAVALCLLAGAASAQKGFYVKPGDRVVFYGDSITEQRLYTTFIETYVVTRFPKMNATFVHSGIGGDRVTGGWAGPIDLRLDRDVFPYQPTVMTIMLAMNDGSYRAFDQKIFDAYATGYQHILDRLHTALPKLRLTLIQASPFDDVTRAPGFPGGYNGVLVAYGDYVKALAARNGHNVADLNSPVVADLVRAVVIDPQLSQKIVPDRVHPGPGGHLVMAEAVLKSWNAPATVTAVTIDATDQKVLRATNTEVSGLSVGSAIKWTQTDKALPFPVNNKDEAFQLALRCSDFVQALDQQPLQVTGLTGANYRLTIDGQEVGTFSRDQLATGINLATLDTPMVAQAAEVHSLTIKHDNQHRSNWEKGQANWKNMTDAQKRDFARFGADETETIAQQRAAAQPKPHQYELTPQ